MKKADVLIIGGSADNMLEKSGIESIVSTINSINKENKEVVLEDSEKILANYGQPC